MQFYTIIPMALCLASTAVAMPKGVAGSQAQVQAVTPDVKAAVEAKINDWLKDIKAVNSFLDTVGKETDPAKISAAAATALTFAMDEGASNDFLAKSVTLDSQGKAANKALAGQFGIIGPAINDTINNPQNLQKNLDAINGARCPPPQGKSAIAQEGAVQAAAAKAVGATIVNPEFPASCTAVPAGAAAFEVPGGDAAAAGGKKKHKGKKGKKEKKGKKGKKGDKATKGAAPPAADLTPAGN